MSNLISIYCDESCHQENDGQKVMLLGSVYLPNNKVKKLSSELRELKKLHNCNGELKWTKVSNSRSDFFKHVIDWFFSRADLSFRCIVVPDKAALNHDVFNNGSHDTFYYKMYFSLLSKLLDPQSVHDIYIDIKDTRSNLKVKQLREILCRDQYDFTGQMIRRIQQVRSDELELLQLADLLIGAVSYKHRGLATNETKLSIVSRIEECTNKSLLRSTDLRETKFNVFVWQPKPYGA